MSISNLRPIEKKVLGALLILSNNHMVAKADSASIAHTMGYKTPGGAITTAIQALEMKNFLTIRDKGEYQVLL